VPVVRLDVAEHDLNVGVHARAQDQLLGRHGQRIRGPVEGPPRHHQRWLSHAFGHEATPRNRQKEKEILRLWRRFHHTPSARVNDR